VLTPGGVFGRRGYLRGSCLQGDYLRLRLCPAVNAVWSGMYAGGPKCANIARTVYEFLAATNPIT